MSNQNEKWVPSKTIMIAGRPCRVPRAKRDEWNGNSGEPSRGVLYDTSRLVVDDKEGGTCTIHNAARNERRGATPLKERFSAVLREMLRDARIDRRKAKRGES